MLASTLAALRLVFKELLMPTIISPRTGVAFTLDAGQVLTVIDAEGEQVSDMLAFNRRDIGEAISS